MAYIVCSNLVIDENGKKKLDNLIDCYNAAYPVGIAIDEIRYVPEDMVPEIRMWGMELPLARDRNGSDALITLLEIVGKMTRIKKYYKI